MKQLPRSVPGGYLVPALETPLDEIHTSFLHLCSLRIEDGA